MTTRQLPTISTDPGGVSGEAWTNAAKGSIRELWKLQGGVLSNVTGTNAIAGDIAFGSTSFDGYTSGLMFTFVAPATNTGAMTVAINELTTVPLRDIKDAALEAGAVTEGMVCFCQMVGGVAYLVSTGAAGAAGEASGKVIDAWTMPKRVTEVGNGPHTLITLGGAEGVLGDVITLPPFTFTNSVTPSTSGNNDPVFQTPGCHFFYSFSGGVTIDIDIDLYRDDTKIQTLFEADGSGGSISDFDYHGFPGFIEILDSNSHDYSIRFLTNRGDVRVGAVFNGVAKLISQPRAAV